MDKNQPYPAISSQKGLAGFLQIKKLLPATILGSSFLFIALKHGELEDMFFSIKHRSEDFAVDEVAFWVEEFYVELF